MEATAELSLPGPPPTTTHESRVPAEPGESEAPLRASVGGAPPLAGTRVALPVVLEGAVKDPTDPAPLSAGSGATDSTADPKAAVSKLFRAAVSRRGCADEGKRGRVTVSKRLQCGCVNHGKAPTGG